MSALREAIGADAASGDIERAITALNFAYARCLDENRLRDWPGFFTDDGRYIIHPRENADQDLEGYWLYLENKKMMRDRVVSLLEVNIYQLHYERRLVSNVMVIAREGDCWISRANYLLVHTNNQGVSQIFSTGEYRDRVVRTEEGVFFSERVVVPDTFTVPSHLSLPI